MENQIAQGVMEQKGFCGLQCRLSRAWESLGVEQGKGSCRGLSPAWGGQVGICWWGFCYLCLDLLLDLGMEELDLGSSCVSLAQSAADRKSVV